MIPERLLELWTAYGDALTHPVRSFSFPAFDMTFEDAPYQMGVINLSRDSSYRESICHTPDMARYRARRMTVEGAAMIDVGAESTGDDTELVDTAAQIDTLRPVLDALVADNMLVSIETYHAEVAAAVLEAGAGIINLTGRIDDRAFYEDIARHQAGLVMCYTPGETARSADQVPSPDVMIAEQLEFFRPRVAMAEAAGIERMWIDPGFGFALGLRDGPERVRYQTESLFQAFRLRELGWPVCVTLPSSVYLFRDEVRCAETSAATLALLSKANLIRSHEVARVQPVLDMLTML